MPYMQIRPIDDPILKTWSEAVDLSAGVTDEIKMLAEDMLHTSRAVNGAGLAAVQVGVPVRLFLMDLGARGGDTIVFINPEITYKSEESEARLEGCLSMPDVFFKVERALDIAVRYTDLNGDLQFYQAGGLAAMCIQHEMDHLDGIRHIDRVGPMKRMRAMNQFNKRRHG